MQDETRETPPIRNILGEYNPTHWDVDESDARTTGEVNVIDKVAGHSVNVDGHRLDHDPDMSRERAHVLAAQGEFDGLHEDAPLPLLRSNFKSGPVEGTQGSYSVVVRLDEPCPECGIEYGIASNHTLAGIHATKCLDPDCDYWITQP